MTRGFSYGERTGHVTNKYRVLNGLNVLGFALTKRSKNFLLKFWAWGSTTSLPTSATWFSQSKRRLKSNCLVICLMVNELRSPTPQAYNISLGRYLALYTSSMLLLVQTVTPDDLDVMSFSQSYCFHVACTCPCASLRLVRQAFKRPYMHSGFDCSW